jgi:HSP20 family protein
MDMQLEREKGGVMALVHRERHVVDWPMLGITDRWRRFLDVDSEDMWIKTEEFHDGDTLVVRAELPDVDPDQDVDISVEGGFVHIRAHRQRKEEHTDKDGYRSEFRYGHFSRSVGLPDGAAADDVQATYADGILEVRVPCPAKKAAEPAKVKVLRS